MTVAPLYLPFTGGKRKVKIKTLISSVLPFPLLVYDDSRLYSFFFLHNTKQNTNNNKNNNNIIYIYTCLAKESIGNITKTTFPSQEGPHLTVKNTLENGGLH